MKRRYIRPWWKEYAQTLPLRKLVHDPEKIVVPYIDSEMTVLEIGPGTGWFSLPVAEAVGPGGKLIAVDIQRSMLDGLLRRAGKNGVAGRIDCRLSGAVSLPIDDLNECVSFTFAFAAVHRILYTKRLFEQVHAAMIPAGTMLMMDPVRCCSREKFRKTIAIAETCGFTARSGPSLHHYHSALLVRMC